MLANIGFDLIVTEKCKNGAGCWADVQGHSHPANYTGKHPSTPLNTINRYVAKTYGNLQPDRQSGHRLHALHKLPAKRANVRIVNIGVAKLEDSKPQTVPHAFRVTDQIAL